MNFTEIFTNTLYTWSNFLPLPLFAFFGAFVEELTPIPASIMMAMIGTFSAIKDQNIWMLLWLLLITTVGKEIGYYVVYLVGDKGEDIIIRKFGRFFGIKHEQVEAIGKHLNKGWQDDLLIFLFRALPMIPTMAVSLVCGIFKVNFRTYMVSSFLGTIVRNAIYMWLGFSGVEIFKDGAGLWSWITLAIIAIGGIVLFYNRKKIKSRLKL